MQSKAGLSLRTSAVQHRVAVRADDCEVGEPGFASLGQVRDWLRVMTLGEVPPDFSVDSKEIKCADLAFKPARYFQSFLFLSVYHYQRPVPFPESMLAGKHPALNECFVIIFESLFHHSMKLAFSGRANAGSVSAVDALSGQRAFITPVFYGFNRGRRGTSLKSATAIFLKRCDSAAIKRRLEMTKTELQVALAVATLTVLRSSLPHSWPSVGRLLRVFCWIGFSGFDPAFCLATM